MEPIHVAGLLLTGGTSRRMGRDKATIEVAGIPLAARVARALAEVAYPVLAVGRAAGTGLEVVRDARKGPLVAFAEGAKALRARGHDGPVLLLACDLPFVEPALLRHLVEQLDDADAVVPRFDDQDQPLCAFYTSAAAGVAGWMVADGARAMWQLLDVLPVKRLAQAQWSRAASPLSLVDVDTPDALVRARRILEGEGNGPTAPGGSPAPGS